MSKQIDAIAAQYLHQSVRNHEIVAPAKTLIPAPLSAKVHVPKKAGRAHAAMTPSDRAKVQVEQPKESKLTKFLKQPKPNGPRPAPPAFDPAAPVN
jgi:hypothetical protein